MDSVSEEPWHVSTSLHDVTSLKTALNIHRCKNFKFWACHFCQVFAWRVMANKGLKGIFASLKVFLISSGSCLFIKLYI